VKKGEKGNLWFSGIGVFGVIRAVLSKNLHFFQKISKKTVTFAPPCAPYYRATLAAMTNCPLCAELFLVASAVTKDA